MDLWQTVTDTVKKTACTPSLYVSVSSFLFMCLILHIHRTRTVHLCTYKHTQMLTHANTNSLGTWIGGINRRLLVAEYFISLYWTHSTCLYLDPADGRWDMVWPIYLSLGKISNLIFTLPFLLTSFLEKESLSVAARQTNFSLSHVQSWSKFIRSIITVNIQEKSLFNQDFFFTLKLL